MGPADYIRKKKPRLGNTTKQQLNNNNLRQQVNDDDESNDKGSNYQGKHGTTTKLTTQHQSLTKRQRDPRHKIPESMAFCMHE